MKREATPAYWQGIDAAESGQNKQANPHPAGSQEHKDWEWGWTESIDAEHAFEAADDSEMEVD